MRITNSENSLTSTKSDNGNQLGKLKWDIITRIWGVWEFKSPEYFDLLSSACLCFLKLSQLKKGVFLVGFRWLTGSRVWLDAAVVGKYSWLWKWVSILCIIEHVSCDFTEQFAALITQHVKRTSIPASHTKMSRRKNISSSFAPKIQFYFGFT